MPEWLSVGVLFGWGGFAFQLAVFALNLRLSWRVRQDLRANQAAIDQGAPIIAAINEHADENVVFIATETWLRPAGVAIILGLAAPAPPWSTLGDALCKQ